MIASVRYTLVYLLHLQVSGFRGFGVPGVLSRASQPFLILVTSQPRDLVTYFSEFSATIVSAFLLLPLRLCLYGIVQFSRYKRNRKAISLVPGFRGFAVPGFYPRNLATSRPRTC